MENASPSVPAPPAPVQHVFFSPTRIWTIAANTLLESVRLKVFYFLIIFALFIIGCSVFSIQFNFQEQFQLLKDTALGAMSNFSLLLAILSTAMLIPKDIEDRTLYTILAKPVPRFEYLVGKLIGILLLLFLSMLLMSTLFVLSLYGAQQFVVAQLIHGSVGMQPGVLQSNLKEVYDSTFTWSLIPAVVMIYVKAAIFASITLLISTFASSWIFTILIVAAIFIIGELQGVVRDYWLESTMPGPLSRLFLEFVGLIFPDLRLFDLVDDIVAGNAISTLLFLKTVALGGFYTVVYLLVGYFAFATKEL
jgi:ABC-2 type transport system permease protein